MTDLTMPAGQDATQGHDVSRALVDPGSLGFGILFEKIRDAVIVGAIGSDRILLWNPAATAMFGYTAEEAIGQPLDLLTPPELKHLHHAGVERVRATGHGRLVDTGKSIELQAVRKDGTSVHVEMMLETLPGDRPFVIAVLRDVSERKRAEEELDRLFVLSPDLLCVADFDGNFVRLNQAWEYALGWTNEELLARPFLDFVHPEDSADTRREMDRLIRGEVVLGFENRYCTKAGGHRWLQWNANPLPDRRLIFAVARDVTEQKHTREELARHIEELARSNTELEQLSYVASHDLQEPLRMIAGYVQLLERRYKGRFDADADAFIHYAVDGAKRMQELINDLLVYSRVGRETKPFELVRIEEVLEHVLQNLSAAIQESGAVVTHDPLPIVQGDAGQLLQLLQNLLANAMKFRTDRPPRVHITSERENGMWRIVVADNGIGIESRHTDRIFTMFQRLHGRDYEGTGIGLAICQKVVERHGGRIWVESVPGLGSTFFFTLPAES